jgi:antitoxin VapB
MDFANEETKKLAAEVAKLAEESEDEAVRGALRERRERLRLAGGGEQKPFHDMRQWLETEIWPLIPEEKRGGPPITKAEKEEILGYGPEGF